MTIDLRQGSSDHLGSAALAIGTTAPQDIADPRILGRMGGLTTRLAQSRREICAAQAIRYRVFADEMGAHMSPASARARRDMDGFDTYCDHLLVIDPAIDGDCEDQIVGTYRLLRQSVAKEHHGFYSASEFAVDDMLARHPQKRFLELGRSCVLPAYRTRRTVELLWQGIWAYCQRHGIDAMFGCASFPGTRPEAHALALSFLHHHAPTKGAWSVSALPELFRKMDLMPSEAVRPREALSAMPPLIKGYLRLGATFGEGAVIDRAFGTTDVVVVLPRSAINPRYVNYYGADATRFAL
ncbi:GNAT family N-acetyltransferase [Pararhizobium haloflavum]|uniref:GNAT family N-acetyltransferase n=1 Tax=Pararhizobium haloflavum TaxID=2037914 RepID=UPI000C1A5E55|nr:GNAT family N-acetyltransferase [Pararhizobium haloflavum]